MKTKPKEVVDQEIATLDLCVRTLIPLSHESKQRVLGYLLVRFNITPAKPTVR